MLSNRTWALFAGMALAAVMTAGCVKKAEVKAPAAPIKSVALVSFSVSNWMGMLSGTSGSDAKAAQLIGSTLSDLLAQTEGKLSGVFQVSRLSGFAGSPAYRGLASKAQIDALTPKVGGQPLPFFVSDKDDLLKASLPADTAKKLCAALKVDAVVVVFSEWGASQGHFVPTKRALAKDIVAVYDRSGNQVFYKRVDETGSGVLGGPYAAIVANEGTIKQWADTYMKALAPIVEEMKKLK